MSETDTPRTDALLSGVDSFGNIPTMEDRFQRMCRHARTLERDLTAATKRAEAAEAERDALQHNCSRLTGMKFSDRMHAALVSRAETAESEAAGCGSGLLTTNP